MMKRFAFFCLLFFTSVLLQSGNSFGESNHNDIVGDSFYDTIQLTDKEKNWLEKNHVVRARVGDNPPLHFNDGKNRGVSVEYLNLIAERIGFQIEYVYGIPWPDALENIKNQQTIDLLLTAKNVSERRPYMLFSNDYLLMPWVIFSRTDSDFISSIDDLIGKTVAVEKGYVTHNRLMSEFPNINLLVRKNPTEALQAVASNEADAYIGNLAISTYIIHKYNLANLKVASPAPFDNHNQAFVVRNDWPELASILNKAIIATSGSDLSLLRDKWFNIKFEDRLSKATFFKWIFIIVSIFLLFLIFFVLWNFNLRVQINRRKKAEEESKKIQKKLLEAQRLVKLGYFTWNLETDKMMWSDGLFDIFRYEHFEVIDAHSVRHKVHHHDDCEGINRWVKDCISSGSKVLTPYEHRVICGDGDIIHIRTVGHISHQNGIATHIFGAVLDITSQKIAEEEKIELENRLQQAQKLEAVGTLAGGIAHDFNNILAAILGYAEMAREDSIKGLPVVDHIDQIIQGGYRARDLVKQILTFNRQSERFKIPVQPALIIKEAIELLRSSLPSTIFIETHIDSEVGWVLADPTQLHQIIMNLCTNAFHAMESDGGILTIAVQKNRVTESQKNKAPKTLPGKYIELSVRDTGSGITPENLEKIFDPYFTTKIGDKGTGMGLSVVHGIVQSYGGHVTCESVLNKGTLFHVILPIIDEPTTQHSEYAAPTRTGTEHILLVDDEENLANMVTTMLKRLGYRVTTKTSSIDALIAFEDQPNAFDLVITDQTMPTLTGVALAEHMLEIRPTLPIILCTGYSSTITEEKALSLGIKAFAYKPLNVKEITAKIRDVLD